MIQEVLKKIKEKRIQQLLFIGLVILVFVLPIPQYFMSIYFTKAISLQTTFLRIILIYFAFLFAVESVNKRGFHWNRGLRGNIVSICLLGLIVTGFIAVVVADDWILALYGLGKGEGYFSLLSYYSIFLAASMLKERRYVYRLLHLFLLFGCIIAVVGVIQFTGLYQFGLLHWGMAYVPMRNPNFYGAFAVLFTGVAMGGFFVYRKDSELTHPFSWWNKGVWYGLVLVGYVACISADSSLVYVGLFMMLLMYLFLEMVSGRKKVLPFLGLVIGLIIMIVFFDKLQGGTVTEEITSVGKQIQEEGTVFGDRVGTGRMQIWKQTFKMLPEYWLQGCGLEQLGTLCLKTYGIGNGIQFDKAHNEYLNIWITEGIFALIIYLVFLFALFIPGLMQFIEKKQSERKVGKRQTDWCESKTEKNGSCEMTDCNEISKIAFFAFFGYIAQAFFNISVVQVAPYFWMICGLLFQGQHPWEKCQKGEE